MSDKLDKALDQINEKTQRIIENAAVMSETFNAVGANISDSILTQLEELDNKSKIAGRTIKNDLNKSFAAFNGLVDKAVTNQEGLNKGSLKSTTIAKQIAKQGEVRAKFQKDLVTAKLAGLKVSQEDVEAAKQQSKESDKQLQADLARAKATEAKLGVTGKLLAGISKIPVLGGLIDAQEALGEAQVHAADETTTKIGTMAVAGASVGKSLGKSLLDPLTQGVSLVTMFKNVLKSIDTLVSDTARNFGTSNAQALELNKGLTQAATTQEGLFGTTKNLNKTFKEINNRYGTYAKLSKENLQTFTRLTKEAGLSGEALGELQDTTYLTKNTLEEQTVEYKGQVKLLKATTGLAINEAVVLEGIKDISAATKLTLGGSAEAMATAVFKAKALGVEMKDLAAISSSLLNFQSSIEDELSAELLTGKQLNLERARAAALADDQATLADELAKNIGTAADFTSMNVIQQGALAKAVGLTRDTLAQSLMKREAMAALSQFEGETETQKYQNAVKQLGVDGARKQLGSEALADQMESVSLQDRMTAAAEKFQEAFVPFAEKVLPALESVFGFVERNMNGIVAAMKIIIPMMVAYKAIAIAASIAQMAGAAALSGGATIAIGLGAAAVTGATLMAIGDGDFPARGENIISTKEGGLFKTSINDDIVVAPGASKALRNRGGQQSIENKVTTNTNINLKLNGAVVSNTMARDNYKTGGTMTAGGGKVDYSAG